MSLHVDAAAPRHVLDRQDGSTILVDHSYGGAVISEAGTRDNVAGLPTSHPRRPPSWPTPTCPGAWMASTAPSAAGGRSKPSWYLVATDDRMIPPRAQRAMAERAGATVTEAPGSHAIYVSEPAPCSCSTSATWPPSGWP